MAFDRRLCDYSFNSHTNVYKLTMGACFVNKVAEIKQGSSGGQILDESLQGFNKDKS